MKDFSKATPRPWATKQTHILSEATWYVIIDLSGRGPIMDVGGKEIAEAKYLTTDPLEIQTNAELIVTSVNNFDDLVKCLRMLDKGINDGLTVEKNDPFHEVIQRVLKQLES